MSAPSFEGAEAAAALPGPLDRAGGAPAGRDQDRPHRLHRPDAAGRALPRLGERAARAAAVAAQERLRGEREPRAQDPARPHPALRGDARARARADRGEEARSTTGSSTRRASASPSSSTTSSTSRASRRGARSTASRAADVGRGRARRAGAPTASRSSSRASPWSLDVAEDLPGDGRRPGGDLPGPHQPAEQRDQVQPGGEERPGRGAAGGRPGPRLGDRPRDRHPEGGAQADLREVLPGGEQPRARRPRAAVSASPWSSTSRRPTGGGSRWRAPPARGARSRCRSRSRGRAPRATPTRRAGVPWGIERI